MGYCDNGFCAGRPGIPDQLEAVQNNRFKLLLCPSTLYRNRILHWTGGGEVWAGGQGVHETTLSSNFPLGQL